MNTYTLDFIARYVKLATVVNCSFVDGQNTMTEKSLKIYNDKKMRKSLFQAIDNGEFNIESCDDEITIISAPLPVAIKTGQRGDNSAPVYVKSIVFSNEDLEEFSLIPREEQKTAREQADYLFGQLIEQAGGDAWIAEQTWAAKENDVIHNNNKGNVAYTRLRLMLKRSHNIYKNFSKGIN